MATSSGLFLATIYNQSQIAERKHVARYWSINTAATAVPLSTHPSPLIITTKLSAAILGGPLFGRGVLPAQYYPGGLNNAKRLFSSESAYHLKKVCYKVSLCEYCQRESCKSFTGLSIRAKMVGGDVLYYVKIWPTSVTLNDLERHNSPYFALFHRIQ